MRILLIEDNPADIMLVEEALREHRVAAEMEVVSDGEAPSIIGSATQRPAAAHARIWSCWT